MPTTCLLPKSIFPFLIDSPQLLFLATFCEPSDHSQFPICLSFQRKFKPCSLTPFLMNSFQPQLPSPQRLFPGVFRAGTFPSRSLPGSSLALPFGFPPFPAGLLAELRSLGTGRPLWLRLSSHPKHSSITQPPPAQPVLLTAHLPTSFLGTRLFTATSPLPALPWQPSFLRASHCCFLLLLLHFRLELLLPESLDSSRDHLNNWWGAPAQNRPLFPWTAIPGIGTNCYKWILPFVQFMKQH